MRWVKTNILGKHKQLFLACALRFFLIFIELFCRRCRDCRLYCLRDFVAAAMRCSHFFFVKFFLIIFLCCRCCRCRHRWQMYRMKIGSLRNSFECLAFCMREKKKKKMEKLKQSSWMNIFVSIWSSFLFAFLCLTLFEIHLNILFILDYFRLLRPLNWAEIKTRNNAEDTQKHTQWKIHS